MTDNEEKPEINNDAEAQEETFQEKAIKYKYPIIGGVALVAVAAIIGISVGVSNNNNEDDDANNVQLVPTASPTLSPTIELDTTNENQLRTICDNFIADVTLVQDGFQFGVCLDADTLILCNNDDLRFSSNSCENFNQDFTCSCEVGLVVDLRPDLNAADVCVINPDDAVCNDIEEDELVDLQDLLNQN